ncbi:MAG: arginine--tRNA ligase, partial [Firmicutes bacterium]|nr:arginine--tRNA ligase [Bacillota bacterium]
MKNIRQEIAEILFAAVPQLTKEQISDMIEIPADNANGDYAFPCFKLAKELRKAPPLIAADVAAQIGGNALFEKVQNVNA